MQFAFATAILKIETLHMRRRFARVSLFIICKTLKKEGCAFGNIGKKNIHSRL